MQHRRGRMLVLLKLRVLHSFAALFKADWSFNRCKWGHSSQSTNFPPDSSSRSGPVSFPSSRIPTHKKMTSFCHLWYATWCLWVSEFLVLPLMPSELKTCHFLASPTAFILLTPAYFGAVRSIFSKSRTSVRASLLHLYCSSLN